MAAEVRYVNGPQIQRDHSVEGVLRGEVAMWVQVGVSDKLRPVKLTTQEVAALMLACSKVLYERSRGYAPK